MKQVRGADQAPQYNALMRKYLGVVLGTLLSGWTLAVQFAAQPSAGGTEPPLNWIDPDTGHRVVRLTKEPGSASLYFNQNGYLPDGKRLVYTTPGGISVLNLETRESRQIVAGRVRIIEAGRKHPRVYYIREGAVWFTDADTGDTRKIAGLPPGGSLATVNADETLLAGT